MVSTAPSGAAGASPAEIAEELLRLEEQSGEKERIACALLRCTQFDPKEVRHWRLGSRQCHGGDAHSIILSV